MKGWGAGRVRSLLLSRSAPLDDAELDLTAEELERGHRADAEQLGHAAARVHIDLMSAQDESGRMKTRSESHSWQTAATRIAAVAV